MAIVSSYFLILIQLIWSVNSDYTKFPSEYDPIRMDIISKRNFNVSNIINEVLQGDWTDNIHCLVELNAIKFSLTHFDEWAVKSKAIDFNFFYV